MNQIIKEAIKNHFLLSFTYKDEKRVVEPYTYGVSKKGNDVLRAYQIGGGSSSYDIGWKLFTIDNIKNLHILTDNFIPSRDGYNPNDSQMIQIFARV